MNTDLKNSNSSKGGQEEVATAGAKGTKPIDRVTLGAKESALVASWLAQAKEATKGFLSLSKSDIVNFILRDRGLELSSREIQRLRQQHYDPVKHLHWITPRLKEALRAGDMVAVAALQEEIKAIELSVVAAISQAPTDQTPRRKRKKRNDEIVADESVDPRKDTSTQT